MLQAHRKSESSQQIMLLIQGHKSSGDSNKQVADTVEEKSTQFI